MQRPAPWLRGAVLVLATGCATLDGGSGEEAISVQTPQAVDGDPQALAWPFHVVPEGELRGFRLRLEAGGTLVAVRPDVSNPEPSAPGWTGSLRDGMAVWSGPSPSRTVPLTIMVRAAEPGDQELQLRYVFEPPDGPSAWTCERWIYRISEERIDRRDC